MLAHMKYVIEGIQTLLMTGDEQVQLSADKPHY